MNFSLPGCLRCPFCSGSLKQSETDQIGHGSEYGILTCHCSQYPIVAGIPILKQTTGNINEIITLVKASRHRDALLALLSPASPELAPAWIQSLPSVKGMGRVKNLAHQWALRRWREQAADYMTNPGDDVTAFDLFPFYFRRSDATDYFAFRFSQPRHLVALSFATLIQEPKKPVLDLACGFGHMTRNLSERAKPQPVLGVDRNFAGLYFAKHYIAPEAEYVCSEAEPSLPFPDDAFSTVFCSDAFHYFVNKAATIREIKRLTRDNGLIILTVLRNALLQYPVAGRPLPPDGYEELVADMSHCLVSDSSVLARYLQKQGPPLGRSAEGGDLANEPTVSVVASPRQEVFKDYGTLQDWPHAEGCLELNPLYTEEKHDRLGNVLLHRTFPTAWYEKDNAECKEYLPETVAISSSVLVDLERRKRTPQVERLIEQCVVLGMPERYRRAISI